MSWSNYWGALSSRQRTGLIAGGVLTLALPAGLALWLLRDPYVSLATDLNSDRADEVAQELERAKLDYRIEPGTNAVSVPRSQLGRARATAAGGQFGTPPSVGLELFKEVDFSSTDFAQKINYQRALQGELTRTIQTISGVRSARVHVILADAGLFKRNATKASAAVSVGMRAGERLARPQIAGIQRLVVAAVPEIKPEDVAVLDESGVSLTTAAQGSESDLSSVQLDLKRAADQYLEGKVARLLKDLLPHGTVSLSIDATLDYQQLRVTTEEPIAARSAVSGARAAGVLVKERQWRQDQGPQGGDTGLLQTTEYGGEPAHTGASNWEFQYQVGHRMEQTLSAPGSIKRLSVAVALQGAPAELSVVEAERLVAHAVGIDVARGDSVAVLLLPGSAPAPAIQSSATSQVLSSFSTQIAAPGEQDAKLPRWLGVPVVAFMVLAAGLLWWMRRPRLVIPPQLSRAETDAVAAKVRHWLREGQNK